MYGILIGKFTNPDESQSWFGFDRVQWLNGVRENIVLVPLPGHTYGHSGVAIKVGDKWMLLAGDAYFYHREMDLISPGCTPGLRMYQTLMEKNRRAWLHNQKRLRDLRRSHGHDVEIFCSHDLYEFERLAGRSARVPFEHLVY